MHEAFNHKVLMHEAFNHKALMHEAFNHKDHEALALKN
jgi:hypothetical protein